MARKITELAAAGAVTPATDLLWIEQAGLPRKITVANLPAAALELPNSVYLQGENLAGGTFYDLIGVNSADWIEFGDTSRNVQYDGTLHKFSATIEQNANLEVRGGSSLILRDSTQADTVTFSHDDIDLNIVGFQTTDINITGITAIKTSADLYVGGDTLGHLETVTGAFGSVQVAGIEGVSGVFEGYNINARAAFMFHPTEERGGLYDDVNNRWMLQWNVANVASNEQLSLYAADSVAEARTQNSDLSDNITGLEVNWRGTSFYDVGLAVMPDVIVADEAITLSEIHMHKTIRITSGTGAITFASDTGMAVACCGWIMNESGSSNQLTATATVNWMDGAGGQVGNRQLADGGWITWWKRLDGTYYITGSGLS